MTATQPTMMTREKVVTCIENVGIIPGVRVSSVEEALFVVEAVSAGGIPIVEIPMTVPCALEIIGEIAARHPHVAVGAGPVWDVATARRCAEAGAMFLTSTGIEVEVVEFARESNLVAIPGAVTPTEVRRAWSAGADFVTIFPCAEVGGPDYLRALRSPFPEVRFIAAGGVNQCTAVDFILAGACAVGITRELIPQASIQRRQGNWIREITRRFSQVIQRAKKQR